MKLVTYHRDFTAPGAWTEGGVVDLSAVAPDMLGLLRNRVGR